MLVKRLRLVALLARGTDDDRRNLASPLLQIRLIALIKSDDQQPAALKRGICDQRRNIRLQPRVRFRQGSVVRVVIYVRNNKRILRQSTIRQVGSELRKRNNIRSLRAAIL